MSLPKHKVKVAAETIDKLLLDGRIPTRISLLVKDLMAYRFRVTEALRPNSGDKEDTNRGFISVLFHNKGMDMIDLPNILNSRRVLSTIPRHLKDPVPIVSYRYTRAIAGKIFNNKKVVDELHVDVGTVGMKCSCDSSKYKYEPCGHVITGDLSIVRDVKL